MNFEAKRIMNLGIASIICMLCCNVGGIILGIYGLNQIKAMHMQYAGSLTDEARGMLAIAKTCFIISLIISGISLLGGLIMLPASL